MNARKFKGNPRVECQKVALTEVAMSLGLSTDLPLAQVSSPGRALYGEDYFNCWIHLVGIRKLQSELSSAPFFRVGEMHIQLLRQRIYYFSETMLNKGLTAPIKLDLLSPTVPFLEITWNETDGLKESLQGLHHFEPNNFARDGSAFLKQIARSLQKWKRPGRRRIFLNREDYESALRQAKEQLIALGQPITQELLGEQLGYDERMIRDWNRSFEIKWHEFKKGS
jgi:hypothetical protein